MIQPDIPHALLARYQTSLPSKLATIEDAWECFTQLGELEPLRTLVHQLAGSGGAYGYDELSTKARFALLRLNAKETYERDAAMHALITYLAELITQSHSE